jgi:peptide/nickel transport system permease protein
LLVVASPSVVGGAVVVETLFGFRGMGALLAEAALSGDGPVVLGVVLFVGLATVTAHALFVPDAAEVAP